MKNSKYSFLIPIILFFSVLGIILYFVHPMAPLYLLLSLLIQVPVIILISKVSSGSSYSDRAYRRREEFEKDNDAQKWLNGEEAELRSIGYKNWSKRGHTLSALNRAHALSHLSRGEEAVALLKLVNVKKLETNEKEIFDKLAKQYAWNENEENT